MANFLYYSTFLLTVGLVVLAGFAARSAISKGVDWKSCVRRFTVNAVVAGLVSGIPVLFGALWLLEAIGQRVDFGHGEALIAAPTFNFVIGTVGALIGRILLGWRPIKW